MSRVLWRSREGPVPIAQVVDACASLMDLGADELSLGDTIGVATPGRVVALLDALAERGLARERTAVHFHDTYGRALSNTMTALRHGITTVDLVGRDWALPYAKSATGNLATEDLIWALGAPASTPGGPGGTGRHVGLDGRATRQAGPFCRRPGARRGLNRLS